MLCPSLYVSKSVFSQFLNLLIIRVFAFVCFEFFFLFVFLSLSLRSLDTRSFHSLITPIFCILCLFISPIQQLLSTLSHLSFAHRPVSRLSFCMFCFCFNLFVITCFKHAACSIHFCGRSSSPSFLPSSLLPSSLCFFVFRSHVLFRVYCFAFRSFSFCLVSLEYHMLHRG